MRSACPSGLQHQCCVRQRTRDLLGDRLCEILARFCLSGSCRAFWGSPEVQLQGSHQGPGQHTAQRPSHMDHHTGTITPGPSHPDHNTRTIAPGPLHPSHHTQTTTQGPSHRDHHTGTITPGPSHPDHHTQTITNGPAHTITDLPVRPVYQEFITVYLTYL